MKKTSTLLILVFLGLQLAAQSFVKIEAESGTKGADWATLTVGSDVVVTATSNGAGGSPGTAARVISYSVTFPQAGVYNLYARMRVNAGAFNDDSYFYGNGFGPKSPTNDDDWILANGLAAAGYSQPADIVNAPGSAGSNVFKWVNMSVFNGGETPINFTVTAGNLTQTFQIGAREDGLDIDKFVFGLVNYTYTVSNLNNGENGSDIPPPPPYVPPGPPIASGKPKYLGGVYSNAQKVNFNKYWNQVTPENAGKWGSVEATRNVMNWSELDSAYKLAKDNGFPFKMHTLIWGSQQPAWMESLPPAEQLLEIKEWFAAVAARYPAIDQIEVVNEPLHAPPDATHSGKYINALGGTGATGWDWVIESFKLARQYFPSSQLLLNDYSIINSSTSTNNYMTIISLLKAQNLIDGIGEQGHAFTTFNATSTTMLNNLNILATSGLPLYITELDIDGAPVGTSAGDNIQLSEYQRVFPLFWEHQAVKGVTLWGYRPGHWRTAQGAYLAYENGAERPALVWLRQYVESTVLPMRLIKFDALQQQAKVNLSWSSANEVNNDYFEIERSADGRSFTSLLTVPAMAGQSNQYTATDQFPLADKNFYRLIQYDKDGRKTYLGVRVVHFKNNQLNFEAYPNPAQSQLTIQTQTGNAIITIADANGRLIRSVRIPAGATKTTIRVDDMAPGTYWMKLSEGATSSTQHLIISRH